MISPTRDRVIVKRAEEVTKSASGLYIPDSNQSSSDRGVVMAVGPGRLLDNGITAEMSVSVGDTVVFARGSGQTVKVDGDDLLILTEDHILAVV